MLYLYWCLAQPPTATAAPPTALALAPWLPAGRPVDDLYHSEPIRAWGTITYAEPLPFSLVEQYHLLPTDYGVRLRYWAWQRWGRTPARHPDFQALLRLSRQSERALSDQAATDFGAWLLARLQDEQLFSDRLAEFIVTTMGYPAYTRTRPPALSGPQLAQVQEALRRILPRLPQDPTGFDQDLRLAPLYCRALDGDQAAVQELLQLADQAPFPLERYPLPPETTDYVRDLLLLLPVSAARFARARGFTLPETVVPHLALAVSPATGSAGVRRFLALLRPPRPSCASTFFFPATLSDPGPSYAVTVSVYLPHPAAAPPSPYLWPPLADDEEALPYLEQHTALLLAGPGPLTITLHGPTSGTWLTTREVAARLHIKERQVCSLCSRTPPLFPSAAKRGGQWSIHAADLDDPAVQQERKPGPRPGQPRHPRPPAAAPTPTPGGDQ